MGAELGVLLPPDCARLMRCLELRCPELWQDPEVLQALSLDLVWITIICISSHVCLSGAG